MADRREVDEATQTETTGHEWDGIKELDTPMPRWWLWTFYATVLWVFRPGARKAQDEAARQIFRNEDAPAPEPGKDRGKKDPGDGH